MEYPIANHHYSWEEYQELEATSEERFEYHDGIIVAMAGATNRHNRIVLRTANKLLDAADKQGCDVYSESVRLYRHNSDRYFYPDLMVTCNPLDQQSKNGIWSPVIVAEVISKGSISHDLAFKLQEYFRISSIQHYLVIEQAECQVKHFIRNGGSDWKFRLYSEMTDAIELPELNMSILLSDIYRGIEFGPEITYAEEQAAKYAAENPNN